MPSLSLVNLFDPRLLVHLSLPSSSNSRTHRDVSRADLFDSRIPCSATRSPGHVRKNTRALRQGWKHKGGQCVSGSLKGYEGVVYGRCKHRPQACILLPASSTKCNYGGRRNIGPSLYVRAVRTTEVLDSELCRDRVSNLAPIRPLSPIASS